MTPRTLAEWTIEAIEDVLRKGMFETEDFDFKEKLPPSSDEKGKLRLKCACAAFANAGGGFLIFGVSNDRAQPIADRLVGISASIDFPEQFGNYPRLCTPSVDWSFKNPPVQVMSGNVIHVVQIPRSWKAPHAVGPSDSGWRFPKRTNKGDEGMNMDEIRASFLGYYEKRLRLQLLQGELQGLRASAFDAIIPEDQNRGDRYSAITFDAAIIESIMCDTYPITASAPNLIAALRQLRNEVSITNNKVRLMFSVGSGHMPSLGLDKVVRQHNLEMAVRCNRIIELCDEAMAALGALLKT